MQLRGKSGDDAVSFLGEGIEIKGDISFSEKLQIRGVVKGKIKSEAILEIGRGGRVDAEVEISRIIINGEFRGIIRASDRVEIHKNGKVFGDIYSPCLIIEAGAVFEGRCNMNNAQKTEAEGNKSDFKPIPDDKAGNLSSES